jgi:hypothetical protein
VSGLARVVRAYSGIEVHRATGGESVAVADESTEMVTIPRSELDAMKAELQHLRLELDRNIALTRMKAHPRPEANRRKFTAEELAQALGLSG